MDDRPTTLSVPEDFKRAERFWSEVCRTLDMYSRWESPWFAPVPDELLDGNPVFSSWSPSLRKGLRILQYSPTDDKGPSFSYWVDWFGGDAAERGAVRELVIACSLSDETLAHARALIADWLQPHARLLIEQTSFEGDVRSPADVNALRSVSLGKDLDAKSSAHAPRKLRNAA